MASLTLRTVKGTPLTNAELDANFTALNTDVASRLLASSNLSDLGNAATARTNLGLGNVENKSSATIRGELTSLNVTTALGFTPYNASNPNSYVDAPGARNAISVSGSLAYNATTGVISFTDAVTSVFGRTGAVALTQSDVTGVLGAGSITNTMLANTAVATLSGTNTGDETAATIKTKLGITTLSGSNTGDQTITLTGDVTGSGTGSFAATLAASGVTAGTYTKVTVDAKGRVTVGASLASADLPTYTGSLTSSQVTTALGFTPLSNATSYLPLAGGTLTGNLTFNGTGLRITGDFSNGTVASRTLFQTSTANSNTFVTAIPNGTAVNSQFQAYNSSDPANSSIAALVASASQVRIVSGYIGTGALNPITFIFSNTEAARFTPSTLNFLIGTSTDDGVNKLQVNGSVAISGNTALHAGNYNSYAPSLTGSGASGTWGISVSGNAATVSSITSAQVTTALGFTPYNSTNPSGYITGSGNAATATSSPLLSALGNYVWSASTLPTGYNQGVQASFVSSTQGFQSYGSVMTVNTYSGGGGALQLYVPYSPTYGGTGLQVRFGNYDVSSGNSWTSWKTLLASDNYSSYTMPLSGGATWNMTYFDFNQSNTYFRITSGPGAFYIGDDDLVNLGSGAVVATPSSRIGTGVAILSTYAYATGQGDNRTHFGYYDGANYVNHIRGAATYFASSAVQLAGNQVLHAGNYSSYALPLTGGSLTGSLSIQGSNYINLASATYSNVGVIVGNWSGAGWWGFGSESGHILKFDQVSGNTFQGVSDITLKLGTKTVLDSGNYSSYALPLSGGTVSGTVRINSQLQVGQNTNGTAYIDAYGGIARFGRDSTVYGLLLDGNNYATFQNANGYVQVGPQNTSWCHFNTDRPRFYFGSSVSVNGDIQRYSDGAVYIHSSNYSSYALPLSGGTVTGKVALTNGGVGVGASSTLNVTGDITSSRGANQGVIYLGTNGTSYLYADGSGNYILGGGSTTLSVAGNLVLHAGNYTSYSPSLSGSGASGTWGIAISGYSYGNNTLDTDRTLGNRLPTSTPQSVRFDFANASATGTGGNYAGVMTFSPWTGTTASTGDASYQLAFGSTATNGGGTPQLRIRKGIDSTWNSWYDLLTSANYNSYSPTLTGGNASGTWGISVTGSAGSVAWTNVSGRPTAVSSFTNDSGYITASGVSTSAVLSATAGAAAGAVGSYAILGESALTNFSVGQTESGANLRYAGFRTSGTFALGSLGATSGGITGSGAPDTPSGTWRCMGTIYGVSAYGATLWLRIA